MIVKDAPQYLERLTGLLRSYGEPERAAAAQRDKGSHYKFLAIRVPVLRHVAMVEFKLTNLCADKALSVYDYVWNNTELYEVMSVPLLYYRNKELRICDDAFGTIRRWIDRIDNWGHCDDLSAIYSYFNHNCPEVVLPFLRKLNKSDDIWRVRASIVSLVHYTGKRAVYLGPDVVLPFLDRHLENKNKFVANAVGWILREMSQKYPRETKNYVTRNRDKITTIARRRARL